MLLLYLVLLAMRANAGYLDHRHFWRETGRARGRIKALRHHRRRNFPDRAAKFADQECNHRGRIMIVAAGEKRVAAFDAVDKAVLHQEVERAIDRDRRRPRH